MQTMRLRNAALAAAVFAAMSGCATVQTPTKGDPMEGFNRTMYKFNDTIDTYALKPAAKGYQWVVPGPVRDSVTNFFSNIGDVYIAANNLAQLRIADGVGDIMRVVINTVFGVGGLFDVATVAKLPKHSSDFGITLGHYGVPAGPYVVLPFLGPSTVRDTAGLAVDYVGNPLTYVNPDSLSWGLFGVNLLNTRANLLGAGDVLDAAAIDKYSFVRNAYLQRRQSLISASGGPGGRAAAAAVPDYSGDSLPKYDVPDDGAAPAGGAAAGAAGAAAGAAVSPAGATPASGASAVAAAPASNASDATAEQPNPASATHVPAQNVVPPSPNGFRWPSLRLH
ncbi:VacJ family lipoprotein [Burkholderia sp. 22PA0106]|uniref:MlaA family lipoprotein n=1 Tax=Burkholderia sp. 22PA0106 TaxID=3237371 RepID=UPI0039C34D77